MRLAATGIQESGCVAANSPLLDSPLPPVSKPGCIYQAGEGWCFRFSLPQTGCSACPTPLKKGISAIALRVTLHRSRPVPVIGLGAWDHKFTYLPGLSRENLN